MSIDFSNLCSVFMLVEHIKNYLQAFDLSVGSFYLGYHEIKIFLLNQIFILSPAVYNSIYRDNLFTFVYFVKYKMSFYNKHPITLFS